MSDGRPRDIKIDGPFLWAEKGIVRRIRDLFDGTTYLDQALAVYAALCELSSDNQGPTFTARKRTISERSGVSLRRVTEILHRFREGGILGWFQNRIPGTKELAPSSYTLFGLGVLRAAPTPSTASPTSGGPSPTSGTDRKRENCRVSEECIEKGSLEKRSEDGVFEIYEAYPRKVGKPAALKAIEKALLKKPAKELLATVKAFADHHAKCGTGEQYIPHPATYFNQERFNDPIPLPLATNKPSQGNSQRAWDADAPKIEDFNGDRAAWQEAHGKWQTTYAIS